MKQPVFGDILRAARNASGLSQEKLAARAGVSTSNLAEIETGKINPTFRTMKLLAIGMGAELVIGFKVSARRGIRHR